MSSFNETATQEKVEVMRAVMDAFNRRDGEALEALFTQDAEIVPARAALEGTIYRGRDGGAQYCADIEDSWVGIRWEVEEIRDGSSWVLVVGRIRGRGRSSGVPLDTTAGWVARFREGLLRSFQTFADRAAALEAVGLRE
jgi:ketosteroid isomerase-like protein